jgi:Na+-driven multidrug efflux pump
MFANLFSMIMPINEMFLVNYIIQEEAITASYKVAVLIPMQLLLVVNSIIIYYFPLVAHSGNDKKKAFRQIRKIGAITFGLILVIAITGRLLNPHIIMFVYGDRYSDAIVLSNTFWFVYALNAGIRMLPMNMLPALGETTFNAILSLVSSIIHFVLDFIFISKFGIMGVAYAAGFVYLLSGTLYWLYLYYICYIKTECD